MRLLLTGDLHIGRTSTRISADRPLSERSAAGAWERIVRLALRERCDAVLLSGDVADQDNRYWEAIGPLERGATELAEAGVAIVAVAGNHDHDVLPRLADRMPEGALTLLGREGVWERTTLRDREGRARMHVDGWSFRAAHEPADPLAHYEPVRSDDLPLLGLVHGDLNVADSRYAPLRSDRLAHAGPDAWLLGHVHAPALHDLGAGRWALYPGSPQALDPGESGAHGVWLLELDGRTVPAPRPRPLSTVRYDALDVDLTDAPGTELRARVEDAVRAAAADRVEESGPELRQLLLRLRLTGATPAADRVAAETAGLSDGFEIRIGAATVRVDAVATETVPAIDLHAHAATQGAPGVLARWLLRLEEDAEDGGTEAAARAADTEADAAEEVDALLRLARDAVSSVDRDRAFEGLDDAPPSDAELRARLRSAARALLRELLREEAA